jgi:ABC-type Fe3+-siderophore transport system permease subunit
MFAIALTATAAAQLLAKRGKLRKVTVSHHVVQLFCSGLTMTLAASSPKVHQSVTATPADVRTARWFSVWQVLPLGLVALLGFLTLTPDGVAEPLQDFAGWVVVGGVATLAVMAVVTGLDRLLDCEGN